MSQARSNWIYGCLVAILFIAFVIIPLEPVSGITFTVLSLLLVGAAYIRTTKSQSAPTASPMHITSVDEELDSESEQDLLDDPESVQVQVLDKDSVDPETPSTTSPPTQPAVKTADKSLEDKLRKRIEKLEKRVQSLQQQLAEEPVEDLQTEIPDQRLLETTPTELPSDDLELSELAIEQILEALGEKLAKGAITKPFYDRLRDKYIARIEKAKKRHKAPSTRGTKESLTGE